MPRQLPLAGERTVPGVPHENYWFRRHEVAYEWVAPLVKDATVLEIGTGEGYGTARLAETAVRVLGVDYDPLTVAHAAARYRSARFVRANLAALPVRTGSQDVIVSLQVIEHVWDHRQFLRECRRTLRSGGRLVISTPNRLTFSPGRDVPLNPFHTHEFTAPELITLVESAGFAVESIQGISAGDGLRQLDERWPPSFVDAQLASPPEQWPRQLADDVAAVRTADFVVARTGLEGCLDLLVTALNGP